MRRAVRAYSARSLSERRGVSKGGPVGRSRRALGGRIVAPGARSGRLRARASLAVGLHAEALAVVRGTRQGGAAADRWTLEEAEALLGLCRFDECVAVTTRALRRGPLDSEATARLRSLRGHALWQLGQVRAGEAEIRRAAAQAVAGPT